MPSNKQTNNRKPGNKQGSPGLNRGLGKPRETAQSRRDILAEGKGKSSVPEAWEASDSSAKAIKVEAKILGYREASDQKVLGYGKASDLEGIF